MTEKKSIQKRVVCLEKGSIHAFCQCGHQCLCESCYEPGKTPTKDVVSVELEFLVSWIGKLINKSLKLPN